MTLPLVEPTEEVIGGWIVHCNALHSWSHKAAGLTAALENMGHKGMALMLKKMKLETAMDVVEWLSQRS